MADHDAPPNSSRALTFTPIDKGGSTKGDDLHQLLADCQLSVYHNALTTQLGLRSVDHLKFVTDADLTQVGMSKPEQRRLWKAYHRVHPCGFVSKLKKKVFASSSKNDMASPRSKRKQLNGLMKQKSLDVTEDGGSWSNQQQDQHIIPLSSITLCKKLGEGEFGQVWQGVWVPFGQSERQQVAVKCVSEDRLIQNPLTFLQEAAIMHKIQHQHIVRLYGVVLDTKSIMLVTELAPLRSLLECVREEALRRSFPVMRLCDYAQQICNGMAYLEAQRLIHRDLAARNILVFAADKVKISDFGLSRSLSVGEEYYRTNFSVNLKLPIAWCAPECINFLKFTSASDVWAFAVTLWEMFTYGFQPWAAFNGQQILTAIDSPRSERLEQPDVCPQEYYSLMLQCWEHDPNNRPKFSDLEEVLPEILPDRVQAITSSEDGQVDHLQYQVNQVIVVLNKRPKEYPDGYYWKGALDSGRTGLFLPSTTVAFISVDYPTLTSCSTLNGGATATFASETISIGNPRSTARSNSTASNGSGSAKLRRNMISAPIGDLKHTAHMGLDGNCFGDVSIDKGRLPKQVVAPVQRNNNGEQPSTSSPRRHKPPLATPRTNHSTATDDADSGIFSRTESELPSASEFKIPYIPPKKHTIDNGRHTGNSDDSVNDIDELLLPTTATSGRNLADVSALIAPSVDDGSGATFITEFDLSEEGNRPTTSLLDEVFDALQVSGSVSPAHNGEIFSMSDFELESNLGDVGEVDWKETSKLLTQNSKESDAAGGVWKTSAKPEALVRPISLGDAKMLEDLKLAAYKAVDKSFERERDRKMQRLVDLGLLSPPPGDDVLGCATQPVKRLAKSLKSAHSKDDSATVKSSFADHMHFQRQTSNVDPEWTPQAQDAYKLLIECGKSVADYGEETTSPMMTHSMHNGHLAGSRTQTLSSSASSPSDSRITTDTESISINDNFSIPPPLPTKPPPPVPPKKLTSPLENVDGRTDFVEDEEEEETNPLRMLTRGQLNGSIHRGFRGAKLPPKSVVPPPPPPKPKNRPKEQSRFLPPTTCSPTAAFESHPSTNGSVQQPTTSPDSSLDFTFESADKYKLLDFVMAAFDDNNVDHRETDQGNVAVLEKRDVVLRADDDVVHL